MNIRWGEVQWGQVREDDRLSWHIFLTFTRMPGRARALCNRNLDADTVRDERPGNGKTCETCYRRHVAAEEAAEDTTMGNTL